MKNKGLIMKLISCVLLIPCFVIPFVSLFNVVSSTGNTSTTGDGFGIFADYTDLSTAFEIKGGTLSTFWMVLTSIMVIALAVLALGYIVLFVLEALKVKCKHIETIEKVVSFLILVCGAVALISAIIAVIANNTTKEVLGTKSTIKLIFEIGSWLLLVPTLAGAIALFAPKAKKSKSKKK